MATRIDGQDLLLSDPGDEVPTHVHATRDLEGAYAFIYIPEPDRTIAVDMSFLIGEKVTAWWYGPASGRATHIGDHSVDDYEPDGSLSFTTASQGEDWVLVLDDASREFGPPGGLPGDIDGSGRVDVLDLLAVLLAWGPCSDPPMQCPADVIADGVLDVLDLLVLLVNWG